MVSVLLMVERAMKHDTSTDSHDAEILAGCRARVRQLLEAADLNLWSLGENGWREPESDDPIDHAARLLLVADLDQLSTAIHLAREITFGAVEPR